MLKEARRVRRTALPEELAELFRQHHGTVVAHEAIEIGVSTTRLDRCCARGFIVRHSRGVYVLPGAECDELYALSRRSDRIVFSHVTALFLHSLLDREHFLRTATTAYGTALSPSLRDEIRVFRVRPSVMEVGVGFAKTPYGNSVRCFDRERAICDLIKYRQLFGEELIASVISRYFALPDPNPDRIFEYAAKMGIESRVRKVFAERMPGGSAPSV